MTKMQITIIGVLAGIIVTGLTVGVTTPKAVQAKTELRLAEFRGDRLFHSTHLGMNGLSCNDCHVDGGRFSHRLDAHRIPSLVSAKVLFPNADRLGHVTTLEDVINQCIKTNLRAKPLPPHSQKLALLDLYLRHLTRFHER